MVMSVMMMLMTTTMMMKIDSDGDVAAQLTVARHQGRFKIPERTPLLVTRL